MSNVAVLLDKAKTTLKASSDAELARHLGVTRASVSNWRTGRNLPDVVQCATLAGLTGEPLARVLGIVGEARAISREEKAVWHKLATSVAAVILLAVAIPLPATPAQAAQRAGMALISQNLVGNAYYVRGRGFLTLIGDVLLWLRWKFSGKVVGPHLEAMAA